MPPFSVSVKASTAKQLTAQELAIEHWNNTPLFLAEEERYSIYPWLYEVAEFRKHRAIHRTGGFLLQRHDAFVPAPRVEGRDGEGFLHFVQGHRQHRELLLQLSPEQFQRTGRSWTLRQRSETSCDSERSSHRRRIPVEPDLQLRLCLSVQHRDRRTNDSDHRGASGGDRT